MAPDGDPTPEPLDLPQELTGERCTRSPFFESLEPRALYSSTASTSTPDFAPATLATLTLHCKVLQGSAPFSSLGLFSLTFNTHKFTYSISGAGIITSGGKYSYSRTSANDAVGLLNKYQDDVETMRFEFTSAHSGLLFTNPEGVNDPRKIKFSF